MQENEHPKGIWSDGTTMWVADYSDDKIYAYDMDSKGRVSSKDFNTLENAENERPAGIWSDGATMWVVDYSDEKIYAYNLNTKARVSSKDFDTLEEADNESPEGLWSDRTTVWVADSSDSKIYAYNAPEMAPAPAISNRAPSVSKVTPTSASVSLYVGNSQTFEASANDPDDNLTSWDWSIDGTSENNGRFGFWPFYNSPTGTVTKEFTHTFSSAGTYTVEATFTDKGARSGSVTWTVEVINRAPVISSASPSSSHVLLTMGGSQTFAATVSDADNNLKSWDWSVDGTSEDSGNWGTPFSPTPTGSVTKSFSHTFSPVGGYRVRATFADTDGDSDSQEWMVQVVQETGDYERDSDKDFNTLDAAGNGSPAGIWSDGTTMWVADYSDDKIYAYNLSTKARDSAKDFNTLVAAGNDSPRGIWSDGTTMWVADDGDRQDLRLQPEHQGAGLSQGLQYPCCCRKRKARQASGPTERRCGWRTTRDRKIYAYNLSTKAGDSAKDFNTLDAAGNEGPEGIWSDGTTMWVADYSDDKIYAYNLSTKAWDFGKDFNALDAAGNEGPEGIWSDGTTMWVTDYSDDKIYAYDGPGMAGPTQPEPTNSPPVISNATPSPSSTVTLTTGDSQTFQVSATDSDSNMTKWKWEVDKRFSLLHGHQEPAETFTATGSITKSFSHTFPDNGTYTVEVTFTDSEGESGTAEWKVEVEDQPNRAPSVSRVSPGTFGYVPTGDVTFTANANDPDDNLKRYEWFVDGESEDDGSWPLFLPTGTVPKSYTHTFSTAGEYTVRVTFTDDDGLSASASWTVTAVEQLTVQLGADNYTVTEDDGEAEITVTISASPPESVSVRFLTRDGTASSPLDYRPSVVRLSFSRDTTTLTQTFPVYIIDDNIVEGTEAFTVALEPTIPPLPTYVSLTRSEATVKILDDDMAYVRWRSAYLGAREREQYDDLCVVIGERKRISRPFTVHFSYTDPAGALSSESTIPSSVTFRAGELYKCATIELGDVASDPGSASVYFDLDRVTSAGSDVASRVTIGKIEPRTLLKVWDGDAPFATRVSPSPGRVSLEAGDSQTFTARATDFDNSISAYAWSVDAQEIDSGPLALTGDVTRSFTHTFPDDGIYTVLATFTDADGQSGSVSWDVTIRQVTPTIQVTQSISDTSVHINESVTVRLRMRRLSGSSGNGGITVSFPDLDQANSSGSPLSSYDSADGSVSTTSYTNGTSKVHYFASGYFPIHNQDGTTGTARYLIVESDDTDWPDTDQNSDYRTLELSFTPKKHGTYEIYYRFWLCGNQYDDCRRLPDSIREDPQQGWHVGVYTIEALRVDTETVGVTVASSPSGRTVTVDGTDYTAPHTATWQSGSSHRLDAPSPQNALGNKRYVFSSWSNGSSQSQTVAPVGDATYTANFTLQHFVSTRTEPGGIGINGAAWYDHGVTAKVGPAPDVEGYDFSHWRRNYQNIGSDPAGVSVAIDTAPFLVDAVYTVSSTVGPPSVSIVSPLVSTSLDPGDSQTFEVRATDPDNNISEWEWSVNGESQGGESLVPSGDISRTFTHTFSTAGIHSVKVTFADARGGSDSVFWTVPVDDPPPPSVSIVSPLEPVSLEPGDSQTFEVKATDPDNNISRWAWSVSGESGGGQPLLPTGSVSRQFSHTFSTVGTYTVEATFTDKKRMSDSVIWSVRVDYPAPANRPPAVYIVSPSSLWHGSAVVVMLEGEIRTFEALAEDPDDNLSGWEWRVDGQMEDCGGQVHLLLLCEQDVELSSPVARSFTYSFDMAGEHEVMVIFTDTEGATGSVSWAISVHDPADIDLPQPPQPSVVPDEPDDGKVAYISGVEANRATESDGDHAKISLWAITRPSCDYFTAGRPAEENPFMSVKEGLWVRLTVTNPSNFPRKSPIGMKVTYRNDARKIEWSREVKRLWPGCAGPDSSDVEMEPQTTRDVYFRVQGPWFYRGPGSPTDGVGRYEYNFRHQEPFKENPDLIVEVVSDEDEIQPPQLTGNVGSGTRVFWQFPPDGVEEKEWLRNYNGVVAIFNTICAVIPYCISPLVLAPDVSNIDLYHNRRQALLSTAEGGIEVVNTGQTTTDVRTEWRNRYTYAGICAPDSLGGATRACHRESVRMSFDRATAVLEIKAPGSGSCPMIETTGSDISIASCESKDGYSVTGAMWHVYGVGNKIVDNYRHVYTRDIRIRHQTDIEVAFNVHLELGPYRGKPYLDPDGGIIDYSAWRSDPDSVYWLVIGTDSDAVHVEGGGIQSVYADGLVIHECGQGNVKVDVVAPTSGDYYVGVFDDYLGEIGLDWEWDSTRSQTLALAAGEEATLSLAACPDSPLGIFEFRLYRQPTGSTGFSVVDKVKQSLSPYDHDNNVAVSRNEVIAAARDYFNRNITRAEAVAIIRLFFGS